MFLKQYRKIGEPFVDVFGAYAGIIATTTGLHIHRQRPEPQPGQSLGGIAVENPLSSLHLLSTTTALCHVGTGVQ